MTTSSAVSVQGLTKRYGGRTVVNELDLEIPKGVVAGFIGPNGAGKTTTMAMLLGLVRRSSGSGSVLSSSIDRPDAYLSRVGALIETPAFYPGLTGVENLRVFATAGGHRDADYDFLIELVGLKGRDNDRYRSYSLGMKQRLGIAASLLGDPELLILDEPSNGLDPEGVREMRGLIDSLAGSNRTVLVSSHDLSELEQVCDWLIFIEKGRLLFQGPTCDLLNENVGKLRVAPFDVSQLPLLCDVIAAQEFQFDTLAAHVEVHTDGNVQQVSASINQAAFARNIVLAELVPQRLNLEDRYLSLINGGSR